MKSCNEKKIIGIASIIILLLSLILMIMDFVLPLNLWTHPVLNFFFSLFIGLGITCIMIGLLKHRVFMFFIGILLSGLAVFYLIIQYFVWWIALISCFVYIAVLTIINILINGNKTDDIALNNSKDYRDYRNRAEKTDIEEEKQEELPEIKSFK